MNLSFTSMRRNILRLALFVAAAFVVSAARGGTAEAASYPTVYKGVDYSKIYDYNYYVDKYPEIRTKFNGDKKKILQNYAEHGLHNGRIGKAYCTTAAGKKLCRQIMYKTLMTPADASVSKYIYTSKTAKKTTRLILVVGHNISFWRKRGYGVWEKEIGAYCGYGRNGFSANRREGDGTTPIGSFKIVYAFGNAANPGTDMTYRRTTEKSWLSQEKATYNKWVETSKTIKGEHLRSYSCYKYGIWVGYNVNPTVYGKGSAIFIHLKGNSWQSSGCVTVTETVLKRIMKLAKNSTYVMFVPEKKQIRDY